MGKKYKTKKDPETGLLRIIALKDFSDVKKGDEGGLIEKENNLSQKGECWVFGDAQVCRRTMVSGAAEISGNAKIWSTNGAYINDTSIDNNKDYVMLTTRDRKIAFIIISGMIDDITFTTTAVDYINNIKIIRQLYGKEV